MISKRKRKIKFSVEQIEVTPFHRKDVSLLNIDLLRQFLNPQHGIFPRKTTNISAKNQRLITREIKKARNLGLLPICPKHNK